MIKIMSVVMVLTAIHVKTHHEATAWASRVHVYAPEYYVPAGKNESMIPDFQLHGVSD